MGEGKMNIFKKVTILLTTIPKGPENKIKGRCLGIIPTIEGKRQSSSFGKK